MPVPGVAQPEILPVEDGLRLRRYDGIFDFALEWYQDPEVVWLVDGVRTPYTMEKLERMYRYLDQKGELYWIEALEEGKFVPIGDVTFWPDDMPIVIGVPQCQGRGIGRKVIAALVERGRELGFECLRVDSIYPYNTASQRCFQSAGFRETSRTEKGISYELKL